MGHIHDPASLGRGAYGTRVGAPCHLASCQLTRKTLEDSTRFHPTPATTTQNVPNPTHSTLPTADTSEGTIKAERNETSMLIVAHV